MTAMTWRALAACRGADPNIFFPLHDTGNVIKEPTASLRAIEADATAEARAMCATCPVQPECLAYAVAAGEGFGVWGGVAARQRRGMRRGLRDCADCGGPCGDRAARCLACSGRRGNAVRWGQREATG